MDVSGKIVSLSKDWVTGKFLLTLEINEPSVVESQIDHLKAIEKLKIKITKWTSKRSLDANAYFHVLVGKIADVRRISKAYCKNILITRYGQVEMIDGEPMIYKTNAPVEYMNELETLHTICVKASEEHGKEVYFYKVYRGSHTYDSREMSILIDGAVAEAKEQGIETLPPEELDRMMEQLQKKEAKHEKHIAG